MGHLTEKFEDNDRLAAAKLKADPRIAEAKKLILDAVQEHQKYLQSPQSPIPEFQAEYDELLKTFSHVRGGQLWYPYIGSGIGNGALVELLDGSIKYDFISGIGAHYWGHSHPDIIASSIDAAVANTIMQGHLQQNIDSLEFSQLLTKHSGMDHCFLTTSGAMANENALKIAFQKKFPATRVLAFEGCFAGRTLAISQITDKPLYRDGLPPTLSVDYLPFYDPLYPEKSTTEALRILKKHLSRYPGQHAVMLFELIQGESGFYPGSQAFFSAIMDVLKEHDIAICIDEVQSFGRTSSLFAFQYFHLEKYVDIITFGKLSQVCGTLFRADFKPRSGLLSQTFTGSTAVIRAGHFIIKSLLEEGYFGSEGKIQAFHNYTVNKLNNLSEKYPSLIQGPWGIGAMIAFTPFGGDKDRVLKFTYDLFNAGVIAFIAGVKPMRVRFLLPIGAIRNEDIDNACAIIEKCLLSSRN